MTNIYTPKQLLARIKTFREFTPLSMTVRWPRSYVSHRAHWIGWLREYNGPGFYDRENWTCNDARVVYMRVQNVGMVIWLNEAAGISPDLVRDAIRRSDTAGGNVAHQTAAARRVLPWQPLAKLIF